MSQGSQSPATETSFPMTPSSLHCDGSSEDLNDELISESEAELDPEARSSNSLARVTPSPTSTFKVSLAPSTPPANETPSLSGTRKRNDFTDQTLVAWGTDAPPDEHRFTQSEYAGELNETMWSNESAHKITQRKKENAS